MSTTTLKNALGDPENLPDNTNMHGHTNKAAIDKIGETEGAPTWNGGAWPGAGGHARQHAMTSADDHQMATGRMIGRTSEEAGSPQEMTAAEVRDFINVEEDSVSASVKYGTEITAAANLSRANHNFKTINVNLSTAANLTLLLADWALGDYSIFRQFGDGQFTIVPENSNVKLPAWVKSAGKGFDMYIECYNVDGSDKYFHIVGGVI